MEGARVVHLELHTRDGARAGALYAALCGWRAEPVTVGRSTYTALAMGTGLGGGIVECETRARSGFLTWR